MKQNNTARKVDPAEPVYAFVDTFLVDVTSACFGLAELLVAESREIEARRRLDNQARAVQLITDAIFEGRKITRDDISQYVINAYLSEQGLADKLEIPRSYLRAALKRWYHFF